MHAALLDLFLELLLVSLDQPRAEHVDVIHAPALRRLVQAVVEFDRLAVVHNGRTDHDVGVVRVRAERLVVDLLVAHLSERARVRADQQRLELFDDLLLLVGRRRAPVAAHRELRGAAEVGVRQDLLVDQLRDLADVAGLDRLVALDLVHDLLRDRLDHRVGVAGVDGLRGCRAGEREEHGENREQQEFFHSESCKLGRRDCGR
ncbi:hypothetical protein PT2222_210101 [Paraburkholderia tropica]